MLTPGIIITIIIVTAITFWIIMARFFPEKIVDNITRRQKLFNYLDSIGLLISAKGQGKTRDIYQKAYQSFLLTMPATAVPFAEEFNKKFIESLGNLSKDEMNKQISDFYSALRKCYKIEKAPIKAYIAEIEKKNES
jgi:hypothetical protein